jgi:uncharacterized protein (DUF1778 family)
MIRKRIQVYADPDTKRRIELAAAKHELAVTEYCLAAIEQQLAEDDVLEQEQIQIAIKPGRNSGVLDELQVLRERILARRGGKQLNVAADLEETRFERDHEIRDPFSLR